MNAPAAGLPVCLACGTTRMTHWASARDVEYATTPESFDYWRCAACDALSIAPVPRGRLGEIYPDTYYSFAESDPSLAERVKQALDRRMFARLFGGIAGDRLAALDVGGGAGWLLGQAKAVEPRLVHTQVVDIDGSAKAAAEAAGHAFFLGRIEEYETDARFDVILLLNLIEHVDDPVAVLAKVRGLLKPGGRILVKTPNHDSLDARLFRHNSWGGLHAPRHWVVFTPESFRTAATRAGLGIERLTLTQGAPFWAVSALEWLARRRLVRVTRQRPMAAHPLFGPLLAAFGAIDMLRRPFARTSQMFVVLKGT
ncbi:class I SAM-dependent methyltransferase [Sphingomonas baiyangensis]|uniref:Class I SAM-dependent methyltransferase n=1 Tax=Sphingomonas baiyangensis TaxID=2572576 RepID=A0A4U1L483_9SPHN|nr:class I SAM-dependent methyltransferase [Sphingomonas baiyangensis]TKD51731.1 class I SAM-dependent methyltransferase [Sphingomonas baiyangensis]